MIIKPIDEGGRCRTGSLRGVTVEQINKRLGFEPNIKDDPCKVVNSWGFTVDGEQCGIWDYKGSHHSNIFSTYGPFVKLNAIFPGKVSES